MMMFLTVFAALIAVAACDPCPNGVFCPKMMTCCEADGNDWGCCPLPDAVCCSDKKHCCPKGTTCNVQNKTCDDKVSPHEWWKVKTVKSSQVLDENVDERTTCPDNSTCVDTYTCCELPSHNYGCCPLENAVCCPDKVHCCPAGSWCDVDGCRKGESVKKLHHIDILHLLETDTDQVRNLIMGRDFRCPSQYTKCLDENGFSKCCPLPNAQCCADPKIQLCCPEHYTCVPIDGCKRLH